MAYLFSGVCLMTVSTALAQQPKIMQPGPSFHGIRDYREVMPGVLYRGGANNGHAPLTQSQLGALCDAGFGTAIYLYKTGFSGPSTIHCSKGSLEYGYDGWEGAGRAAVHRQIYDAIKNKSKPVFIHCWNGIHATGAVAATALMQFCDISPQKAIQYWKVGVAPRVQYPSVIQSIETFRANPKLELTPEERSKYCPRF
jgi:rhodanese-related sulfurtransferase